KGFSIGCCGFCYSPLDKPLVFLFTSDTLPNGYVVFDARNDPYAEKPEKQPWAGFEHEVCLHLVPFITANQNREEIVMYSTIKADDPSIPRLAPDVKGFFTHFVFPACEIFLDGEKIELKNRESITLTINQVLIVRYQSAAIGIRIFYATDLYGKNPEIYLIDDGNKYNVLRLTVVHSDRKMETGTGEIGFYIVGKDDIDSSKIRSFCNEIRCIRFDVKKREDVMEISKDSTMILKFNPEKWERMIDRDVQCILSVNGNDIGGKILEGMDRRKDEKN
ncbi:MAG TPA: hypothetical protein PK165_07965, partial [bacterium]|nr:hypothetical protein [bacterium]